MAHAKKKRDTRGFEASEGRYRLRASAQWVGPDLLVSIRGGTGPHIGAVALAQPRPSLKDPAAVSATASVLCALGHKEDALVKEASELLASALEARVVVAAGIHWDGLDRSGIRAVEALGRELVSRMVCELDREKAGRKKRSSSQKKGEGS